MTQIQTGGARSVRVTLPLSRTGFGLGTGILTTEGQIPVEFLEPGDRIITHDRGAVPLARLIARSAPAFELVRLRPSVLHPEGKGRAFLVSARQKILLTGWRARAMFGKPAVLVEIGRLADGAYITRLTGRDPMRLLQLAFDDGRHVLPLAGGTLLATSTPLPAVTGA